MNKQFLGTQYGGWVIDLDSIKDGDTIICGEPEKTSRLKKR